MWTPVVKRGISCVSRLYYLQLRHKKNPVHSAMLRKEKFLNETRAEALDYILESSEMDTNLNPKYDDEIVYNNENNNNDIYPTDDITNTLNAMIISNDALTAESMHRERNPRFRKYFEQINYYFASRNVNALHGIWQEIAQMETNHQRGKLKEMRQQLHQQELDASGTTKNEKRRKMKRARLMQSQKSRLEMDTLAQESQFGENLMPLELYWLLLKSFAQLGNVETMLDIYEFMVTNRIELNNDAIYGIICSLNECGGYGDAFYIFTKYTSNNNDSNSFNKMNADINVYNAAFYSLSKLGDLNTLLCLLYEMSNVANIKPNHVTWYAVLEACKNHLPFANVIYANYIFNELMPNQFEMIPDNICIWKMLCIYNQLSEKYNENNRKKNDVCYLQDDETAVILEKLFYKMDICDLNGTNFQWQDYTPSKNLTQCQKLFLKILKQNDSNSKHEIELIFTQLLKACDLADNKQAMNDIFNYFIKHYHNNNNVELTNDIANAALNCFVKDGSWHSALKLYFELFYQMDATSLNVNGFDEKENILLIKDDIGRICKSNGTLQQQQQNQNRMKKLKQFYQRSSNVLQPNVDTFNSLLKCVENMYDNNGDNNNNISLNCKEIEWIHGEMTKYSIVSDIDMFLTLFSIADKANEIDEIQRLSHILLRRMTLSKNEENLKYYLPCDIELIEKAIVLLYKYGFNQNAIQMYDFIYRQMQLIDHWSLTTNVTLPDSEHAEPASLQLKRKKSKRKSKIVEDGNEDKMRKNKTKMVDFDGYQTEMAHVGLRYVLENEWMDLNNDLLVITGKMTNEYACQLRNDLQNHLKNEYHPSISCVTCLDNQDACCLKISSHDIKKWIMFQSFNESLNYKAQHSNDS